MRRLPAVRTIASFEMRSASSSAASRRAYYYGVVPHGIDLTVLVVHHHVRDLTRVADLGEERDVPFAGAVDNRDRLPIGVVAERAEHERERELLRAPLDEHHCAREEDLGALGVELRGQSECLLFREGVGLQQRRAGAVVVAHEHELLEPVDPEEDGRVGRVEHLVAPAFGQAMELRVQVSLRRRAQVQLRLLDQDHMAADPSVGERCDRADERQPAVLRLLILNDRRGALRLAVGRREQRRRPEVGREEQRRRRAFAVQVQRPRRTRVEEERPAARVGLDVNPQVPVGDVGDRRHRCRRFEQRPHSGEDGRLAGGRLADEHAHGAGLELDVARPAVAVNRDPIEDGHVVATRGTCS